jgi:hypothetical protein
MRRKLTKQTKDTFSLLFMSYFLIFCAIPQIYPDTCRIFCTKRLINSSCYLKIELRLEKFLPLITRIFANWRKNPCELAAKGFGFLAWWQLGLITKLFRLKYKERSTALNRVQFQRFPPRNMQSSHDRELNIDFAVSDKLAPKFQIPHTIDILQPDFLDTTLKNFNNRA